MVRYFLMISAAGLLAACQPTVPDSAAGVGFENSAEAQARRDAALARSQVAPQPVTVRPPANPASQPLPAAVVTAVDGPLSDADRTAAAANSGEVPLQASPSNPAPEGVSNSAISTEQDFASVRARRTIQSDAERLAANRAQYTQVEPTALPKRPGSNQPNIVEYALRTNNPVGAQLYRRNSLRASRSARACAAYPSPDQAQIAFLSMGGPQQDRKGLDPDGDGYACSWDPRPFRKATYVAPEPEVLPELATE